MNTMPPWFSPGRGLSSISDGKRFMKKSALIFFSAIVVGMFVTSVVARAEYTQAEWEKLKKGEILISEKALRNPDGSQKVLFVAKIYMRASPKEIWKVLRDYDKFEEFMPNVSECEVLKKEGPVYWVRYKTKVLWVEVNYYLKLVGVEKYKRIEYQLDESKENDIRATEGYWVFEKAPDGKGSVVTYCTRTDTGIPAPEFIARKAGKMSLPMIVKNVKKRVESGGTWKKTDNK